MSSQVVHFLKSSLRIHVLKPRSSRALMGINNRFKVRYFSSNPDVDLVKLQKSSDPNPRQPAQPEDKILTEACGPIDDSLDEDDLEEMFIKGPMGMEWGGPTRGGKMNEPTVHGDWQRKGRCSDF
ncbi:hypothetical protein TrST_g7796 [Triparma strigata]|uniref:Succinate dehydrogenase assembly factor 4, mitochondrial n=1 Tax=Triparma strigata TaxID=1606541 RepID=A0A9W7EKE0_9STRA|nr:hypothetical protein TrST_g7796 [Triparma strigata]